MDEVFDQIVAMLNCHVSQFYEWLPYNAGHLDLVPGAGHLGLRHVVGSSNFVERGGRDKFLAKQVLAAFVFGLSLAQRGLGRSFAGERRFIAGLGLPGGFGVLRLSRIVSPLKPTRLCEPARPSRRGRGSLRVPSDRERAGPCAAIRGKPGRGRADGGLGPRPGCRRWRWSGPRRRSAP